MKSKRNGKSTSACEVTNVTPFGVWVLFRDAEYFLHHKRFPWFRKAAVEDVLHVVAEGPDHLRWPRLDVDLHVESLKSPDKFPLVSKAMGGKPRTGDRRKRRA